MDLSALLTREPPVPWCGDSKLPWSDAAFSSRMLHEHFSQEHGRASRRLDVIHRHVAWIHSTFLSSGPARVLDLGCGPGLYTSRLAKLGHTCVGIDFSPAAIEYARAQADRECLSCEYQLQDVREVHFGTGFDAALLLFGEFNTFSPAEARDLLAAACEALGPSGSLILEVHTEESVRQIGEQPPTWFSTQQGLFSDQPHLCLRECTWHAAARAAIGGTSSSTSPPAGSRSTRVQHRPGRRENMMTCSGLPDFFGRSSIHRCTVLRTARSQASSFASDGRKVSDGSLQQTGVAFRFL